MNDPELRCPVCGRLRSHHTSKGGVAVPDHIIPLLPLIGLGFSNAQIARKIGLSDKTVKNYISILLTLFAVENRTQLALLIAHLEKDHHE